MKVINWIAVIFSMIYSTSAQGRKLCFLPNDFPNDPPKCLSCPNPNDFCRWTSIEEASKFIDVRQPEEEPTYNPPRMLYPEQYPGQCLTFFETSRTVGLFDCESASADIKHRVWHLPGNSIYLDHFGSVKFTKLGDIVSVGGEHSRKGLTTFWN